MLFRSPFKKVRDTNGTFHAKIGSIKGQKWYGPNKAEDIKKRWQEYTEFKTRVYYNFVIQNYVFTYMLYITYMFIY